MAASDAFVEKHCSGFVGASQTGEQRLEWQQLYMEYCLLYESALEAFVASQGCTVETFVHACRDALENSAWTEHRGLAACVLAMAEYDYFLNMMSMAATDGSEHASAGGQGVGSAQQQGAAHADEDELLMPSADGLSGVDEYGEPRPGLEQQHEGRRSPPRDRSAADDGDDGFM